jgi:hypothetical protein
MKKLLSLVSIVFVLFISSCVEERQLPYDVYAGGVAGIESLCDKNNSSLFRVVGGNLYIHNTGWMTLSEDQRFDIIDVFDGSDCQPHLRLNFLLGKCTKLVLAIQLKFY